MTAWTLVFHVLGFVFWIGGLLISTSVLAQHAEEASPEARQALEQIETRLLKGMANPGALLTLVTGVILVLTNPAYYLRAGWLHGKLALVVVLIGFHWLVLSRSRSFLAGRTETHRRDWMTLHGAIALIFIGILILVLPGAVFWK